MACREIDEMRQEVLNSLRGNVNTWQYNLQARWGDPRVYEAELQERERQDTSLAYDLSRRNTTLLDDAYTQRAQKQVETHRQRMDKLKHRGYQSSGTPPQSGTSKPRKQPPARAPNPAS